VVFRGNASAVGAGLYLKTGCDATVSHCTFAGNTGAQISCVDSSPAITNSIIAFSINANATPVSCGGASEPTVEHCVIFGNAGGDSLCGSHAQNLFTDPLFCDFEAGDLALHDDSPCLPGYNPWLEEIGALGAGDCGPGTGVAGDASTRLALSAPRPNPFRGFTIVDLSVPEPVGDATLDVYNLAGRRVRTLLAGPMAGGARPVTGGTRQLTWDGRDDSGRRVASGVYFFTLRSQGETVSRKAVLLR
jgi:hypothetical protein